MSNQEYKAIGYFFAFYERNLEHIRSFQEFKNGNLSYAIYSGRGLNTFSRFLAEFRVARNISTQFVPNLLSFTSSWIQTNSANNVDQFAIEIRQEGITNGKLLTSLSSKVLFLNSPHLILPIDSQVRRTVNQTSNNYSEYISNLEPRLNSEQFIRCLDYVKDFAIQVEENYMHIIPEIELVRRNRLLDLSLWSLNGNQE